MTDDDLILRGDALRSDCEVDCGSWDCTICGTDRSRGGAVCATLVENLPAVISACDEYVVLCYDGAPDAGVGRFAATIEVTVPTFRGDRHIKLGATGATRSDVLRSLADALEDHDV